MANRRGKSGSRDIFFIPLSGSKITADIDCGHGIKTHLFFGRTNLDSLLKSSDITLPTKAPVVKPMAFPIVIYRCESWTIKKAELWITNAFELWCWRRPLRVPCTTRGIKPVNLKINQPWIFIGKTDVEAETPVLWPPNVKSWLIGKDSDAGKDWRQEEKGMAEDEMFR